MKIKNIINIFVLQFVFSILLFSYVCHAAEQSVGDKEVVPENETSAYLAKFRDTYICPETGLTISESRKANLGCKAGDEVLSIIKLMIDAGWRQDEIDQKIRYFIQGRPLMQIIPELQSCNSEGKVRLEFFIMPYCPYGTKFVDSVLRETINDLGDSLEWYPHMVFAKDNNGKFTSMHGEEELQESIRQVCIREKWSNAKWLDYFTCFSAHVFSDKTKTWKECAEEVGINIDELNSCTQGDLNKMIEDEYSLIEKYRAVASPTSVYDCHKTVIGAIPYDKLKPAICSCFTGKKPAVCQ